MKLKDNRIATVTGFLIRSEKTKVGNLKVLKLRNYAVASFGVLVHNADKPCNEENGSEKPSGSDLDRQQEAQREFDKNDDFTNSYHDECKPDVVKGTGGQNNRDGLPEEITDAYEEWIDMGRPKAEKNPRRGNRRY